MWGIDARTTGRCEINSFVVDNPTTGIILYNALLCSVKFVEFIVHGVYIYQIIHLSYFGTLIFN